LSFFVVYIQTLIRSENVWESGKIGRIERLFRAKYKRDESERVGGLKIVGWLEPLRLEALSVLTLMLKVSLRIKNTS
jgi:hypothetical protein